jgi:CheY-like chemotaxis protein
MCRGAHSVRTEVSGMPLGKAKFMAHPPYWQEAVKLELCVLHINHMATMINPKVAVRTPILLVDDDIQQLDLLALTMKTSGFSVVTASTPVEAISLINEHCLREIDVAVGMNGCVLAAYLKARCPELKIVSCSGALDISQDEKMRVDPSISQSDGIGALLSKITEFGQSIRHVPLFSRWRTMPLLKP